MGLKRKRQSKRLTTRKREGILKKARAADSKKRKMNRKFERKEKVPSSVMRTDEENEAYAEIRRQALLRKLEYEEKMKNFKENPTYFDGLLRLISRNEVMAEIVDARDPASSRNSEVEEIVRGHGKKLVMIMNYTQYVPRDVVDGWKSYFNERGLHCIELEEAESLRGMKVGIFGNPRSGKNFVAKHMSSIGSLELDFSFVSVPPSNISLSSILRGCHSLMGIAFKPYMDLMLREVSRNDVSLHYQIPEFSDANELLGHICRKHQIKSSNRGIDSVEAAKIFLAEFVEHRILFWRDVKSDENSLSFKFPQ